MGKHFRNLSLIKAAVHFQRKHGFVYSGALTFNTLLALIPILVVGLIVLTILPGFQQVLTQMEQFMFSNFIPEASQTVRSYLDTFVSKAQLLSLWGTLWLIVLSFFLVITVEQAMNTIWNAPRRGLFVKRMLHYCLVLVATPLLIAGCLLIRNALAGSVLLDYWGIGSLLTFLLTVFPIVLLTLLFAFLFVIGPKSKVPVLIGLWSGFITALLFIVSKLIFTWYILLLPTYHQVYGSLAVIPLSLMWIDIMWAIFLYGASLCYILTSKR